MHPYHRELLRQFKVHGGKAVHDAFLANYLGNPHPRFPLSSPAMRKIARDWMAAHKGLAADDLAAVIGSLVQGKTMTEKLMSGLLLDVSYKSQREIDPSHFDRWLNHLIGWAEVDTLCTGRFPESEIPRQWTPWKKWLDKFSRSANIQKRRASLVLLCSPLRKHPDLRLLKQALRTTDRLGHEKDVLITKAVSWALRSAAVHHPAAVKKYVTLKATRLPRIAVRETLTKIATGTKTKRKRA